MFLYYLYLYNIYYTLARSLLDSYERSSNRHISMVAEVWGDPEQTCQYYGDREQTTPEFHLVFNFNMMHLKWEATAFRNTYEEFERGVPVGCYSAVVFGSHDENRLVCFNPSLSLYLSISLSPLSKTHRNLLPHLTEKSIWRICVQSGCIDVAHSPRSAFCILR